MPGPASSSTSDWVMCGITFVYVVATILILVANRKSAKASAGQLEESKKEFETKEKLEILPFLYWDFINGTYPQPNQHAYIHVSESGIKKTIHMELKITNVGNGPAMNVLLFDKNDKQLPIEQCSFAYSVKTRDNPWFVDTVFMHIPENHNTETIKLKYSDLKGNSYSQNITFDFSEDSITSIHNHPPVFIPSNQGA